MSTCQLVRLLTRADMPGPFAPEKSAEQAKKSLHKKLAWYFMHICFGG
jgi:hypothetical protein